MSFTEKAKIVVRGSICCAPERTSSDLDRVIHFGRVLGDQEKGCSPKKLKSLIAVPYVAHLKVQVPSFNMNLIFSVACS